MMIEINGLVFNEKLQSKMPAKLLVDEQGNASLSTQQKNSCQVCQLSISPRIKDSTRFITLRNDRLFESTDNDAIDNMLKRFANQKETVTINPKYPVIMIVLAAFLFGSWSLIHYGLPSLSHYVAMKVPAPVLVEQGQLAFESMDVSHFSASELSEKRQAELTESFKKLLPPSAESYEYQLHFRKSDAIGANAFALPSGDIIITDDLVNLAATDDEINAVLLHEIAHVELRHSVQSVVQTSILLLGVVVVTGDVASLSTVLFAIPALLLESGYSRNMELESDDYSLAYMVEHQVDPIAFSNILTKIIDSHLASKDADSTDENNNAESNNDEGSDKSQFDYWASHPPSDQRIERFRLESKKYQQARLQ